MRNVEFYRSMSGDSPVEEFLDSLSDQHAQKVLWVLRLFERMDIVPSQYFKKLAGTGGIWEVRVRCGSNSYRLLGFLDGAEHLILTGGFSKKQRKAPGREIDLAVRRRTDYLSRRKP